MSCPGCLALHSSSPPASLAPRSTDLHGPLPASLSSLSLLEELALSSNALTGALPAGLCGGGRRPSPLRDLLLANNDLSGRLQLPDCDSLIFLDAQVGVRDGSRVTSDRATSAFRIGPCSVTGLAIPPNYKYPRFPEPDW